MILWSLSKIEIVHLTSGEIKLIKHLKKQTSDYL